MTRLDDALEACSAAVGDTLDGWLGAAAGPRGRLVEAMRHAALSGGKRLRPFLVVQTSALFGLPAAAAMPTAAAVEMVHCYSLVHDDLPAMDDSDLRRGRPTTHKAFDEATAILAGDGLLTEAFALLADPCCHAQAEVRCELVAGLAAAAGAAGMVGGQMIDLSPARAGLDLDGIRQLQSLKTGALIAFSCEAGAILAGADDEARAALLAYSADLGLAFQIADDLLDVLATPDEMGKPTGQDVAMDKATFVGQLGVQGAQSEAQRLVARARARLDLFGQKADLLRDVADFVVARRH